MKLRDTGITEYQYKTAFLTYADSLAPEVHESLGKIADKYRELFGQQQIPYGGAAEHLFLDSNSDDADYILGEITGRHEGVINEQDQRVVERFITLRNSFRELIERFALEKPWLKQSLLTTLAEIVRYPGTRRPLWSGYIHGYLPIGGGPVIFEQDGWSAADEHSDDFRERTLNAFTYYLDTYIEDTISTLTKGGQKRAQGRPNDLERVKWLVRWTIQRSTKAKIGAEFGVSKKSIDDAFEEFRQYGLPVRKGIAGRPKKVGKRIAKN
jgi:hypothetical protein